jgi:type IX secretion system substrate protein
MKQLLLLFLVLPLFAEAQLYYPVGFILDSNNSTTFTFSDKDSLTHDLPFVGFYLGVPSKYTIDTSSSKLWQIGNTLKPIFSNDTMATRGIMTDTLHSYPKNANDFFTLKIDYALPNFIVDFWHKFETNSLHAGGLVEFSTDTGLTWMNVADCGQINKVNFYSSTDTIFSGEPAFMGTRSSEQLSRLQFMNCFAVKTTATDCFGVSGSLDNLIYLRFRFVSDSTIDSLSGWMIDSIRIEVPGCVPGAVKDLNNVITTDVYPNPTNDILHIDNLATLSSYRLVSIVGTIEQKGQLEAGNNTISIQSVPSGMYMLEIYGLTSQKTVFKVLK